jgi:hypothetical protein
MGDARDRRRDADGAPARDAEDCARVNDRPKRPHMPLGVKLAACLIEMGYHPADAARAAGIELPYLSPDSALAYSAMRMDERPRFRIDFDHGPPLETRQDRGGNLGLSPHANDPRFISPMAWPTHRIKTDGVPHLPLSGDKSKIAKVKRLEAKRGLKADDKLTVSGFESFGVPDGSRYVVRDTRPKPKRKIPSRPFQKRKAKR